MSKRNKSKRILLSILLCGCMSSYAHAQTYTFDYGTYTVEDGTASYTYTDSQGVEHTITYKTATAAENSEAVSTSYETSYSNEGTATYDPDGEVDYGTWSHEIQGEEVDFDVTYTYDETLVTDGGSTYTTATGGIDNSGNTATYIEDITGTFVGIGDYNVHGDNTSNPDYVAGSIYNDGENAVIGNITAGFLVDGDDMTDPDKEHETTGKELGGAIYNGDGATINSITNSFFLGDDVESAGTRARTGGAIYNSSESYIGKIENCYFIGDMAITTGDGTKNGKAGAIYNGTYSEIGTITGSYFIGNEATMYGGAIENEYSTIGSITGSFFIGNKAMGVEGNADSGLGGAIYNYDDGTDPSIINTIKNCYFIDNEAQIGGAIYNKGSIIGSISGSYFVGNKANAEKVNTGNEGGGAIYNGYGSSIGEITGCYFIENESESHGGAIYNYGSSIGEITDSYFIGNKNPNPRTEEEGGTTGAAITNITYPNRSDKSQIGNISGCYFIENTNEGQGGAINNFGSEFGNIQSSWFINNAGFQGGAIYQRMSEVGDITESYFIGNKASNTGGAIYNLASEVGDITGSYFMENESGINAGAILNENTTIESISGSYFIGNKAGNAGGAIYNWSRYQEDWEQNSFNDEDFNRNAVIGNITDSYFISNEAASAGGAIYNDTTSNEEGLIASIGDITGSYFVENTSSGSYGGAIYNSNSTIGDITGSYFLGNTAAGGRGGAIYNSSTGTINSIQETSFIGNSATSEDGEAAGGAIYNAGTITGGLTLGDLIGNYAEGATGAKGGAIYDSVSTSVTINGNVSDNYVKTASGDVAGGVIYLDQEEGVETEITVSGNVTGNHAETADGTAIGGAFYNNAAGTLTIGGSEISGNWASAAGEENAAYGGAIYNEGSLYITAEGVTISGNYVTSEAVEAGGGAILNAGTLEIEGGAAFSGNYAVSTGGDVAGGAIANVDSGTLTIGEDVTFSGNYVVSEEGKAGGGAIYNAGTINGGDGLTLGSLTGNYAEGATGAYGGAVYSTVDKNVTINGDVSDNYARVTKEGDVTGGVIYLYLDEGTETTVTVNGDVTGNHAETASGTAMGGAFYNNENGTLTITGDISGNYVSASGTAAGGAVYSEGTLTITADSLSGNYAESASSEAAGGAIFSTGESAGTITVTGAVTGNYAEGAGGDAGGGAIYNENEDMAITITGDVTDNYVSAGSGTALGGAIYSQGTTEVTGAITGNYAEGSEAAGGGAIYNEGALTVNATSIENNYAKSSGDTAYGGAIYVDDDGEGSSITVTGNITGNYAVASSGDAKGGAIYTSGDVNVIADGTDISVSGNYTEGSDGTDDNAIYLSTADGTVTFDISNNGSVTLSDNIRGEDGYSVDIIGDSADSTTFYLLNDAYGAKLSAGNVTINTVNNEAHAYALKSFTLTGDVSMVADVDLNNQEMDRFTAESYGSHQGTLDISDVNVIGDTSSDTIKIAFAEEGLKDYVTASATESQSAIFKYGVEYDDESDGGYIEVTKTGVNPAVMVASVAQMGAYGAASRVYDYAFEHSEYYMNQPYKARFESVEAEDADEGGVYRVRRESSLTERGVWVRPFSSFETVPFSGNFTVKDKYYGMLLGVDSDLKDLGGGWASLLTGYVGYQGVHQEYDGNSIRQDGGIIGVTGSFYKKNFFTAVSVAGSLTTADGRTEYGREKTHLYTYGLAAKAGWNLDYADGKYSILPSFMASYTNVGADDYTNAAGVRVDPDTMHAIQLNPNIKWIVNCRNGLRPYLTVGEVWTVGESMGVSADGYKLDDLSSLKPYTEYGLGVQKRWNGIGDGYLQVLGHAGGRRGVLFNLGLRWNF